MNITKEKFANLLNADKETEHIEFKKAETSFNFDSGRHSVCGYCVALANEKGGKLVFGVSDKMPRKFIGTKAFPDVDKLEKDIFNFWKRRVFMEEYFDGGKKVLIINIPSRPIGEPLQFKGQYLMRVKDRLESMTPDQIKKIISEAVTDYSSQIIKEASLKSLSIEALKELRRLLQQSGRFQRNISKLNDKQLLTDLRLIQDNKITIAALVLLGREESVKQFLPYAETRFGYKLTENEIRNQDTEIYAAGYLLFYDKIWQKINSRNITLHIPHGLLLLNKKAFNEETIREAINNAIIHRDYSVTETNFVLQFQSKIIIKSPGGFLEGVTTENIIDECKTRNKLIADVLYKCEFVEQFGSGVNLMVEKQLSLGKNLPNYDKTDLYHVILELDGTIKDIEFAKYVLRIADKKQKILNDQELIILYSIKDNKKVKANQITKNLLELGLIEKIKFGKYILSKQYYDYINRKGEYTRRRGLDKETNKRLILEHLKHYKKGFISDFIEVLKGIPKPTINKYLSELKKDGKIDLIGNPKISKGNKRAYWKLKSDTGNDTGKS